MRQWLALLGFLLLCLGVAALAGFATAQSVVDWYPTLVKPSWQPPSWLFGPVWTVLYILMAIAAWLVWKGGNAKTALMLFGVQLALNLAWSFLVFRAHSAIMALVDIAALWLAIAATMWAFALKNRLAAWLLVPYIAWVSFASALNTAIWLLN